MILLTNLSTIKQSTNGMAVAEGGSNLMPGEISRANNGWVGKNNLLYNFY